MTSIKLIVTGAKIRAEVDGVLTSGAVGIPVTIQYDSAWDGLTKNLVCISGKWGPAGKASAILNIRDSATVANEVMIADNRLYLGVEGRNADGTLVIPTMWADCGPIRPGVDVNATPSAQPTLPIWAQLQQQINDLKVNGTDGGTGVDGGYYIPAVSQVNENTMKVSFTASKKGMAAVADQNIVLPAGAKGYTPVKGVDYFTEADKREIVDAVYAQIADGNGVAY